MKSRIAKSSALAALAITAALLSPGKAWATGGGGCSTSQGEDGLLIQTCITYTSSTHLQASVYTMENGHNTIDLYVKVINADNGQVIGNAGGHRRVDAHQGVLNGPDTGVSPGHYYAVGWFTAKPGGPVYPGGTSPIVTISI